MAKFAMAFVAGALALASPAFAYEVGDTISLTEPVIGCFKKEDAVGAMLKETVEGRAAAVKFAIAIQREGLAFYKATGRDPERFCDVISPALKFRHRVMEIGHTTVSGGVFICVRTILDDSGRLNTNPCMWVHMEKKQ